MGDPNSSKKSLREEVIQMSFEDKSLQCSDCGANFTWSVQDQEFFQSKGYTNTPKRCPSCRETRKAERGNSGGNSGGYSSGYTTRAQMFPATCSDCGKATQVPFEPRNGKPVYCSDCYRKVKR
jgi:CxxC-x17-CxxC domain-containing protein